MSVVPAGYKQTEVGVIPEDWEDGALGDVTEIRVGRDLIEDRFSPEVDSRFRFPVFSNTVSNSGLYGYYSAPEYEGDSLTVVGRGVGLGTAFARTDGYGAIGRLLVLFPVRHRADAQYLTSYINNRVTIFVETSGIPQLTGIQFANYKVALPPLPEQRAIAAALSDVDALLAKLDQFIAKKRDLKQAAMQQLLTGQTRLPGFSGEWALVKAGEIGRFRGGSGFPLKFQGETSGEYPLFKVSDMNNAGNETFMETANNYISEALRKQLGATAFPAESIVFAKVGAAVFLERKKILSKASCLDNNMAAFVMDVSRAHCPFIHYVLLNTKLGGLVSTTALPSLSGSVLAAIELPLPSLPEQTAIAIVLSDIDAELAALEARRDKTRALKQGMMQELLTGRIRLV